MKKAKFKPTEGFEIEDLTDEEYEVFIENAQNLISGTGVPQIFAEEVLRVYVTREEAKLKKDYTCVLDNDFKNQVVEMFTGYIPYVITGGYLLGEE